MIARITPALLRQWDACYDDDRIAELYGGRAYVYPLTVARDQRLLVADRLWVLLRPEVLGDDVIRLVACWAARQALPLYERQHPGDRRPRTAIEVAERYVRGQASEDDLGAAWAAAAWAAAEAAAAAAAEAASDLVFHAAGAAEAWNAGLNAAWAAVLQCATALLAGELDPATPVADWPDFGWPEVKP